MTGDSGSAGRWWERSPGSGYSGSVCRVGSNGTAGISDATKANLLAPFGVI